MAEKNPQRCAQIRDKIDKWDKYWTINRSLYYEWMDFILGDQWREDESKLFERYNKIPLVFNKLGVLQNHLDGDLLQNTPNLQILPDDDVPPETAQIRAALIRNITLNSDATTVYERVFSRCCIGGYAAYGIRTRFTNNKSFYQEPEIFDIEDPNRCYWDISSKHPCKVDGMYAGYKTRLSRAFFRAKYGKDIESQIGTTAVTEDSTMAFADDDSITLVNHFEREEDPTTIYLLSDNSVVDQDEFNALEKVKLEGKRPKAVMRDEQMLTVLQKREVMGWKIKHIQFAGDFILDEEEFPSELLPLIFVDQKSYYTKQGQQITRSFFKDVKDAQKYLNYLKTQCAYLLKVGRYDQFIAPRKALAAPDTQQMWRDPSVVQGALIYDETASGAKPEQIQAAQLSPSLIQEYQTTLQDIQSGTGMYNTQLGELGNEVSGTAIDRRNQRGTKNTATPYNSLKKAVAVGGEIINQMIPKLYDTERSLVLPMPESESKRVKINSPKDAYGTEIENDMTKGEYKIRLKAGPSYEGQKEEALDSLKSVIEADRTGQVFPMIADLYAENLPLDNSLELRNRLRTLVPPDVIEAGKTGQPLKPKPQQPNPDMINAQLKQAELQYKMQQAQQDAAFKMRELELKQSELQRKAIETHQDMSIEWERLQHDKELAAAELQESMLRYQAEAQRVGADLQINHSQNVSDLLMHGSQISHEKEMQDKEHLHQSKNLARTNNHARSE